MTWQNPLQECTLVAGVRSEVTPFVFRDRLYRLENFVRFHDFPGTTPEYRFHEDGFRIRDVAGDRIISIPLLNHYFATAFPWEGRVYVFAGDYGEDLPWWHIRRTVMISSDDLITWTKPQVVLEADPDERLFNYAVCHARGKFYLLYETDDQRWPPPFTLRFCVSDDLLHWQKLGPEYLYGQGKYTGGPALYFDEIEDWFYCLYLEDLGHGWETRVTRSRDLRTWHDAPPDRPVVTFDPQREIDPATWPGVKEASASDLELCEFHGNTVAYWINGDQQGAMVEYTGTIDGPLVKFLRAFFA